MPFNDLLFVISDPENHELQVQLAWRSIHEVETAGFVHDRSTKVPVHVTYYASLPGHMQQRFLNTDKTTSARKKKNQLLKLEMKL